MVLDRQLSEIISKDYGPAFTGWEISLESPKAYVLFSHWAPCHNHFAAASLRCSLSGNATSLSLPKWGFLNLQQLRTDPHPLPRLGSDTEQISSEHLMDARFHELSPSIKLLCPLTPVPCGILSCWLPDPQ